MQNLAIALGALGYSAFVAYCLKQALFSEPWGRGLWTNWNRSFVCVFLSAALFAGGFVTFQAGAHGVSELSSHGARTK